MRVRAVICAVAVGGCMCGCRGRHAAADPRPATTQKLAATAPAATADTMLFEDRAHGFSIRYPSTWTLRQDPENVFTADARANDESGPELSIAVPKLPAHVPGMVPLGAVQSGYVDDLRKRLRDVRSEQEETGRIAIPGANLRKFAAAGKDDKGERKLDVLIVYRDDRLYIITAEAPAAEAAKAQAAFDQAVASWRWLGPSRQ
jgi:hypothetical protein